MLATVLALGLGFAPEGVSPLERARLMRGETVAIPQTHVEDGHTYVGSIAYAILRASPEEVLPLVADPQAIQEVLPLTSAVRRVPSRQEECLLEIHQGNSLVHASYTLKFENHASGARFWLDSSRPHDIEDAWGFVRVQPLPERPGEVLLTYGALVDLGSPLLRSFFERRVRKAIATVPERLRTYLSTKVTHPRWASVEFDR